MEYINQGTIKVYPQEAYAELPGGCSCVTTDSGDCDWCRIYYHGIPCNVPYCKNIAEAGKTLCSSCATKGIVTLEEQLYYNTHRDEDYWLG
jgi:hypothetical protein